MFGFRRSVPRKVHKQDGTPRLQIPHRKASPYAMTIVPAMNEQGCVGTVTSAPDRGGCKVSVNVAARFWGQEILTRRGAGCERTHFVQ